MADGESRCTTMADQRNTLSTWAELEMAKLPPLTPTEIGALAALVRQIDERTD